jgi:peroxiredoxin Q/BCP
MSIKIGDNCPSFTLQDQDGKLCDINALIGEKNLIIYFYPKDDTPGCTKEACMFRDSYEEFKDLGCEVIGISSDSISSHKSFAQKHRLSFTLLADTSGKVRKQFGVPGNLFGLIPGRVTYIIDKQGVVRGIFNSLLDPAGHLKSAFETVKKL